MSRLRRRRPEPLRRLLYVSDTKLDMLFDQLAAQLGERSLRRLCAEVKVDLKLVSVSLRQNEVPVPTQMAKLRLVERFIDENHHVGSVDQPGTDFFRGRLEMQWGWLEHAYRFEGEAPIALFRGDDGANVVVLAGSRRHVLGEHRDEGQRLRAGSATPNIISAIGEHISEKPDIGQWIRSVRAGGPGQAVGSDDMGAVFDDPEWGLFAAADARWVTIEGPSQTLEFLAWPLVESDSSARNVHAVLGTPIYVAMSS